MRRRHIGGGSGSGRRRWIGLDGLPGGGRLQLRAPHPLLWRRRGRGNGGRLVLLWPLVLGGTQLSRTQHLPGGPNRCPRLHDDDVETSALEVSKSPSEARSCTGGGALRTLWRRLRAASRRSSSTRSSMTPSGWAVGTSSATTREPLRPATARGRGTRGWRSEAVVAAVAAAAAAAAAVAGAVRGCGLDHALSRSSGSGSSSRSEVSAGAALAGSGDGARRAGAPASASPGSGSSSRATCEVGRSSASACAAAALGFADDADPAGAGGRSPPRRAALATDGHSATWVQVTRATASSDSPRHSGPRTPPSPAQLRRTTASLSRYGVATAASASVPSR